MEEENQELTAEFFESRDERCLYFGCKVNDKHIYFVPYYHSAKGSTFVDGCALSQDILLCSGEEIVAVKKVFDEKFLAVSEYYDIFTCTSGQEYNYPPERLREILEFDLTETEREVVEGKLSELTKIYLIQDNRTGFIKIGRSDNPEQRLKTLIKQDTLLPEPNNFTLIGYTEAYPILETNLHKQYAAKRIRGEWFNLTDEEIQAIVSVFRFFTN